MGRDAFKSKRVSSVSISGVIDTGVNSNLHCSVPFGYCFWGLTYIVCYGRIQR
ncbi:MAG: hypothetical protein ACLUQ4_08085 [Mediterraneibacter faecis]